VQKVFPYDPTLSHNTSVTGKRTNRRQTDSNGIIDAYSIAVACQKIVYSIGLIINVRKRKFPETKVSEDESFWERMFHGTKVLGNESFTYKTFVPENKSFLIRKFQLQFYE